MRKFIILLFLLSTCVSASSPKEYQGVYEGVELIRNHETKGISYFYIDLSKPKGKFTYKSNLADTDDGLECTIENSNILWSNPVARIPLICNGQNYEYELIFTLDASMLKGSTFSLNSDAMVSLLLKGNDVASEVTSMWVVRTENNLLLNQLKNAVPYNK